jgi:hypothetical protein
MRSLENCALPMRGSWRLPPAVASSFKVALDVDDAAAPQRIAHDQGERPGEVLRSLIREASRRAA